MEDSPQTDPSKAGKTEEQKASLAPKSGERPDQGHAPVADHEIPTADNPTKAMHEASAHTPPSPEVASWSIVRPLVFTPLMRACGVASSKA